VAQVKALFYLPLKDNDGRSLKAEIRAVKQEAFGRFTGWTFLGYVQGAFRMADGSRSADVSGAYVVVLDDSRIPELEEVLLKFKGQTLQEAIYLEIQRDVEIRFL